MNNILSKGRKWLYAKSCKFHAWKYRFFYGMDIGEGTIVNRRANLDKAINQRDTDTPHCFAESMVTLGEFKMLHRFQNISSLLWHGIYDENNGTYCYSQHIEEDDDDDIDLCML